KDAKSPAYGTVDVAFSTSTDLAARSVTLTEPRLVAVRFPTFDAARAANVESRIKAALDALGAKRVPLDMVLASLRDNLETPPDVALKNDPPTIFVSDRPASLLIFDGVPVLALIVVTTTALVV